MTDANPYQSPLELGARFATRPSAWRFVPFDICIALLVVNATVGFFEVMDELLNLRLPGTSKTPAGVAAFALVVVGLVLVNGFAVRQWYRARYQSAIALTILTGLPDLLILLNEIVWFPYP